MAFLEFVHGEYLGGHGDMLFLAFGIGEAQVDELDLLLLDHLQYIICRHGHAKISFGVWLESSERGLEARKMGSKQQYPCHPGHIEHGIVP